MKTAVAQIPGMKSAGRPRTGYQNLFNNSSKRPRGAESAGLVLWGTKLSGQIWEMQLLGQV